MNIYYTDGSCSPNPGPGGFAVIKDNKELTPQFKKIKEAATQLVYFTANKGKLGYNANEKRKGLESILSELKIMQKTNFEKKYILQKRKAIGKKIDDLLLKIIKDIEISIR